jgi:hypothetical protein
MTWVERVLESTKGSESPKDYYYWAALSAISAVVANKVYLDRFYYKLWPNIYVVLVGKSGLRKGPPVALAKSLVEEVNNTRIFSGRASIEGIINELAQVKTRKDGGPPVMDSRCFIPVSEFASFIIQNDAALTILTDLYDRNYNDKTWGYLTKGGGTQTLKEPYITILGASNEVHFKDVIPQNAVGGGFLARTFIIHADKKSTINSLTEKPESMVSVPDLANHLREVAKLEGQFMWTRPAKELYDTWYTAFCDSDYEDDTGTLERISDSILKVALLLSLSRGIDLELTEGDVTEAIRKCLAFVPGARKVALGAQGKSVSREGTAVVLRYLLQHPEHAASKTLLLRKFWGHFNADELKVIIDSLVVSHSVRIEQRQLPTGRGLGTVEEWVILEPQVLENYNKLMREK